MFSSNVRIYTPERLIQSGNPVDQIFDQRVGVYPPAIVDASQISADELRQIRRDGWKFMGAILGGAMLIAAAFWGFVFSLPYAVQIFRWAVRFLTAAFVLAAPSFLSAPAQAQEYGTCAKIFAAFSKEKATISPIQGIVIDRERRRITYVLPDRNEFASFKSGNEELQAAQKELRFVGKSWYLILRPDDSRWQPHYARDAGDGSCEHYPLAPVGSSG